jgi:hypothetical protein
MEEPFGAALVILNGLCLIELQSWLGQQVRGLEQERSNGGFRLDDRSVYYFKRYCGT